MTKFAASVLDNDSKFATGVVDTGGKFAAGVVGTNGKFDTGVVDTGGAPSLANLSAKFSGAWGKMIHEKNLK
jgi:hypothetical protein